MSNQKQLNNEESKAYMVKMSDPEYIKKRYEDMDRALEFMDLCSKGAGWIIEIHNFFEKRNITPNDLINNYLQK